MLPWCVLDETLRRVGCPRELRVQLAQGGAPWLRLAGSRWWGWWWGGARGRSGAAPCYFRQQTVDEAASAAVAVEATQVATQKPRLYMIRVLLMSVSVSGLLELTHTHE